MSAEAGALSLIDTYEKRSQAALAAQQAAYAEHLRALQGEPVSDRSAWLKMSAGFLKPTRTGSFGESLGNAVSGYEEGDSKASEAKRARQEKIATIRLAQGNLLAQLAQQGFAIGKERYTLPPQIAKLEAEAEAWRQRPEWASGGPSLAPVAAAANSGQQQIYTGEAPPLPEIRYARGGPVRGYAIGGDVGFGSMEEQAFPTLGAPRLGGLPGASAPPLPAGGGVDLPPLPNVASRPPLPNVDPDRHDPGLPSNVVAQAPSATMSDAGQIAINATTLTPEERATVAQQQARPASRDAGFGPEHVAWAKRVMADYMKNPMAFSLRPDFKAAAETAQKILESSRKEALSEQQMAAQMERLQRNSPQEAADRKLLEKADAAAEEGAMLSSAVGNTIEARKRLKIGAGGWTGTAQGIYERWIGDGGTKGVDIAAAPIRAWAVDAFNKGALSDAEQKMIAGYTLGLDTGDEDAAWAAEVYKASGLRAQERASFLREYKKAHGTLDGGTAAWTRFINENPMITPESKSVRQEAIFEWQPYLTPGFTKRQAQQSGSPGSNQPIALPTKPGETVQIAPGVTMRQR